MNIKIGLSAAAALALAGCDSDLVQTFHKGTTKAFATCMEQAKKQNAVREDTAKAICADKHSVSISDALKGTAGYWRNYGAINFSGTVKNEAKDHVVTAFSVFVSRKDKGTSEFRDFTGLWIEPGSSYQFSINDLDYTRDESLDISKGTFTWTIERPRGLKVAF